MEPTTELLCGNAVEVLRTLRADSVQCCVTSPPYFGLRRYGGGEVGWDDWIGQLGSEPSPDLYIRHLVEIFREVRRVLRPDGVCWLNIGDSWVGGKGRSAAPSGECQAARRACGESVDAEASCLGGRGVTRVLDDRRLLQRGLKPLDMVLVPEQLVLALRTDGWYVRSIVCWAKSNPMPESVNGWRWGQHKVKTGNNGRGSEPARNTTEGRPQQDHDGKVYSPDATWQDCPGCPKCSPTGGYVLRKGAWRPTDAHEYILMLTKTSDYYCDREAVMEQGVYPPGERRSGGDNHKSLDAGSRTTEGLHNKGWEGNGKRNLRSVWSFPTLPFRGAHFACYPPRLVEVAVKASTSERGCCPKCGSPWARVVEGGLTAHDGDSASQYETGTTANRLALLRQAARSRGEEYSPSTKTLGWLPTCQCCQQCDILGLSTLRDRRIAHAAQRPAARERVETRVEQEALGDQCRASPEGEYQKKEMAKDLCTMREALYGQKTEPLLQQNLLNKMDVGKQDGESVYPRGTDESLHLQTGARKNGATASPNHGKILGQNFGTKRMCASYQRKQDGQPDRELGSIDPSNTRVGAYDTPQAHAVKPYPPVPSLVLDPFVGSGTTAVVAESLGRSSIGIDTCEDYLTLARLRLAKAQAKREEAAEKASRISRKNTYKGIDNGV